MAPGSFCEPLELPLPPVGIWLYCQTDFTELPSKNWYFISEMVQDPENPAGGWFYASRHANELVATSDTDGLVTPDLVSPRPVTAYSVADSLAVNH